MHDDIGLMCHYPLNKMIQKFKATGSLASCPRSGWPSASSGVAQTELSMLVVFAYKECIIVQEVLRHVCPVEVSGENYKLS
ncbi:hypothetical protein NPIL_509221 [Nephila pilipes]|uniref:Uncharacterized protein n=1 Tax=Nephila pilipes TaxID=299642 RepID=A0A8X6N5J1_NEPPI|nr:hypothetical protein NPIL_509221 [Nephila pilipes]